MQVSLDAKRNGVAFRRATFQNPLPKLFRTISKGLFAMFIALIAFGESAGRARAASELARQGYMEEAKNLMLQGGKSE